MGEVLCSTENSPFLKIDHIHAKINQVCCAALAIGKRCMNVRKNKLLQVQYGLLIRINCPKLYSLHALNVFITLNDLCIDFVC